MKESRNTANLSVEDLQKYRKALFLNFDSHKFMYCSQIEVVNQFMNNKNICYPFRKELKLETRSCMEKYQTNLIRKLLLADKAITVQSKKKVENSDDESDDETIHSILKKVNQEIGKGINKRIKFDLDCPNLELKKPEFNMLDGDIIITSKNYQLVLSVLRSLKHSSPPVEVLEFLLKIVGSMENIEFKTVSASHRENLKHLFYFKILKYSGYALKHAPGSDEIYDRRAEPTDVSFSDFESINILKSELEKFISSTISKHIENVLNSPDTYCGSVGIIAGLSYVLKYLSNSLVTEVTKAITSSGYLESDNFIEVLPLCICIIENFDDKFTSSQKDEMIIHAADASKSSKSRSK